MKKRRGRGRPKGSFGPTRAECVRLFAEGFAVVDVARQLSISPQAVSRQLRDAGCEALTIEVHVRYAAPVRFDDCLTIHARLGDVRGARFRFDYAIARDGELVADGWTIHAVVDRATLRPTRVPSWLADAIASADPSAVPGRTG